MPLASLQGAVAESENDAGALPGEGMRPGGPAAVLGPRDGNLWLADALGQPFLVPLTAPGLRARCKAALNKLEEAREQAEMGARQPRCMPLGSHHTPHPSRLAAMFACTTSSSVTLHSLRISLRWCLELKVRASVMLMLTSPTNLPRSFMDDVKAASLSLGPICCSSLHRHIALCDLPTGLVREHHDEVARFLAALQPEGAAEAQKLPGLSLSAELSLAIQRGQYTQCVSPLCPVPDILKLAVGL